MLGGRFAPGERLPTQRALAAELGVNMASVREGVKRLEQLGLVEVRHGDAMRVRDWRLHGGPDVLVHLIARAGSLDVEMVGAVMEARRLLLSESARLAASRRSPEQAELLASLAEQLAGAADDEAAQHLDFAWFAVLIQAAGNVVFLLVMNSIRALYLDNLELFRPIVSGRAELAPRYRAAALAVAERRRRRRGRRGLPARRRAGDAAAGGAAMSLAVLSRREASIFAAFADAVAMPVPPRPGVAGTDAVAGFDGWLARAPRLNRIALRASLLGLGLRLRGLDRGERAASLGRLGGSRVPLVPQLLEALRASAAAAYYGDDGVMRGLGYDAGERVRRGREDTARVKRGLEHLAELFWAAGARSVLLPLARLPELRDGDSSPLRDLDVRAEDLKLLAFHPLGSARMDARPSHGVLDGDGRVHGTEGVYVCDGSAIPSSLGVNPQITIMTLATRLAAHLCHS